MSTNSKFLSLILRHKPETIGLTLDDNGWANVDELLQKVEYAAPNNSMTRESLEEIVATNNKQRFEFNEGKTKIRARQGHSIDVDLELEPVNPPAYLYHGTAERFLPSINDEGILKGSRQHVHLSADYDTAVKVGKRHGKPVVLRIRAHQFAFVTKKFYLSNNGVWLTDDIPSKFINEEDWCISKETAEKGDKRAAEIKAKNDAIDAQHNLLLQNIKDRLPELEELLSKVTDHWNEEDLVYRFYHTSFKVYHIIALTEEIDTVLTELAPYEKGHDKYNNMSKCYRRIIEEGAAVGDFQTANNRAFQFIMGPSLTAFWHAKYFLTMAVKYGTKYDEAPHSLHSGWAALLHLYKMR